MHGMMMQAECPKVNQMIRINNMLTILEVFIICLLIFLWKVLLLFIYYSVSSVSQWYDIARQWQSGTPSFKRVWVKTVMISSERFLLRSIDHVVGHAYVQKGKHLANGQALDSDGATPAKILQSFWPALWAFPVRHQFAKSDNRCQSDDPFNGTFFALEKGDWLPKKLYWSPAAPRWDFHWKHLMPHQESPQPEIPVLKVDGCPAELQPHCLSGERLVLV